ncbi:unnamed protein product [Vitrella brassicaformis CCMP3155]|uniref:UBX domain-containing protein n=1 Tax=Vitrella brassicaformis (strain CCMP3155) TaxID=1169540 RepID=A0A0G4F3Z7_VITBC|nr:unnamed protein product [Vitrella brassicaformis CCMP3155]|mmetsp:Transcript_29429/g.73271  ORF Transcript_29429/g.73271 Transcript_29429/m.73271 type:complete len:263 (-) Transcript_29429:311-1099(-)|eukprot:CEM06950.1 unnamed protein product [Vitrella brassicaformis CCMP3155]
MPVRSLQDLKDGKEEDPDKKKTTSSYTGGEKSGLAVENPESEGQQGAFGDAMRGEGELPPGHRKVTVYKNGFTIDDGDFRDAADPQNAKFIEELRKGFAPPELSIGADGNHVRIALVDKSSEDYDPNAPAGGGSPFGQPTQNRPAAPPVEMFTGEGRTLGAGPSSSAAGDVNVDAGAGSVRVDDSKPKTTIQFRFHNGQRKAETFNVDSPVAVLHDYVMQCAPVDGEYQLIAGFPPKPITSDPNTTLKDAGLLNSQVTQKLI